MTDTLQLALEASGVEEACVAHRPRLLSDNGSSHIAGDLAEWLENRKMGHVRSAPNRLRRQEKIERWHQTLKNRILEAAIGDFDDFYNHRRNPESLKNLTPADVYFGRG